LLQSADSHDTYLLPLCKGATILSNLHTNCAMHVTVFFITGGIGNWAGLVLAIQEDTLGVRESHVWHSLMNRLSSSSRVSATYTTQHTCSPDSLPKFSCTTERTLESGPLLPKRPPPGPDLRFALRAGASRNRAPGRAPDLPNRAPGLKSRSLPCPEPSRSRALPTRFPPRSRTYSPRSRSAPKLTRALPENEPEKVNFFCFIFYFFGFVRGP
jgi:hypothetical protein